MQHVTSVVPTLTQFTAMDAKLRHIAARRLIGAPSGASPASRHQTRFRLSYDQRHNLAAGQQPRRARLPDLPHSANACNQSRLCPR
jgi:hypothetical protein